MNEIINVRTNNGVLTVNSREVARRFEKQHKHVLDCIRNLIAENSAVSSMVTKTEYAMRGKLYPQYELTRDGFSLLVMSFAGPKALNWKIKYINAFNAMEQELKNRYLQEKEFNDMRERILSADWKNYIYGKVRSIAEHYELDTNKVLSFFYQEVQRENNIDFDRMKREYEISNNIYYISMFGFIDKVDVLKNLVGDMVVKYYNNIFNQVGGYLVD